MADPATPQPGSLSGQVLFYQNPEPLDAQRHAKLGVRVTDKPFGFAAAQHFIPVHVGEFALAGLCFPVVFAGEQYSPLAVMGLNAGENLFIQPDGGFRQGAYVPSWLRRYPFVLAQDTNQPDRMLVCIDRASDLITESEPKIALFAEGQPTEFTKNCMEFCRQFDVDRARTDSFVALLRELDLFEMKQTHFTPRRPDGSAGEPQMVAEYFAVSEEKLKALPADKYIALRDNGALMQIHAHLMSLLNFDRLVFETIARAAAAQPVAANA